MITPGDLAKMRTTGHTMILVVDTLERYQKALQAIKRNAGVVEGESSWGAALREIGELAREALQEQNGG